ncbi:MAG: ABC transporter ATP-binding protein [Candidatus Entotheonellia bacterium]
MGRHGALVVEDLHLTYQTAEGPVRAVRGVTFTVKPGEFYTLLGASGCGKTTVLRCIAGLESPDRGHIAIGDQVAYSSAERIAEPPYRRDIGMVFQSYAIWPHLNVFDNVSFPLVSGRRRFTRQQVYERTMRALNLVHLEALAHRPAPFLSGGQQQRVALARALVAEPTVLLLDEPLSNLDAKLRAEMRIEIKSLVKVLEVTTLYVTHDQTEALTMSDRVAVMQEGVFIEEATPKDIYLRPHSAFTAMFLGDTNLLAGRVVGPSPRDGMWRVETTQGSLLCPAGPWLQEQKNMWIACRPEGVIITRDDPRSENVLTGRIAAAIFAGDQITYSIDLGDQVLQAKSNPFNGLQEGDAVFVQLPPERCLLIPREHVE